MENRKSFGALILGALMVTGMVLSGCGSSSAETEPAATGEKPPIVEPDANATQQRGRGN